MGLVAKMWLKERQYSRQYDVRCKDGVDLDISIDSTIFCSKAD